MKYPEHMLLKLRAGSLARIDAVTSNRNGWIRDLIDGVLGGPSGPIFYHDGVPDTGLAINQGWQCPSCKTIWSPSVRSCGCNSPCVPMGGDYGA